MGLSMKDRELGKMELDDLWNLHERLIEVLDRKLEGESAGFKRDLMSLAAGSEGPLMTSRSAGRTPRSSRSSGTRTIRQRRGRDEENLLGG